MEEQRDALPLARRSFLTGMGTGMTLLGTADAGTIIAAAVPSRVIPVPIPVRNDRLANGRASLCSSIMFPRFRDLGQWMRDAYYYMLPSTSRMRYTIAAL